MSDSASSQPGGDEPRLSWRERELLNALRRLANAQAQLRSLENELARHTDAPDSTDAERVEALEAELTKLRAKAGSRFGGGAARERIPEVVAQQRRALERVGFHSYESFASAGHRPRAQPDAGDPALVEFARHELAAAAAAYAEVLAITDDVDEAPVSTQQVSQGSATTDPEDPPEPEDRPNPLSTIDLTRPEAS